MEIYIGPAIVGVGIVLLLVGFLFFKKQENTRQENIEKMNRMKTH